MSFIYSYKRLEKLCGEVLNDERRVSAYIDKMLSKPQGSYLVYNWDEDLRKLKHYRWIRNQISHEPNCTEENMCNPGDAVWIDGFYDRIMNCTDPLTLYDKAKRSRKVVKHTKNNKSVMQRNTYSPKTSHRRKHSKKSIGLIIFLVSVSLIAILIMMKNNIIWF